MRKVYSHLSAQERIRIDELRNREGLGVRQIALRMGRDKSTVSRELRCGLWFASDENESHRPYRPKQLKTGAWTSRPFYSAMTAQRKAERRARQLRKPMRMAYDPLLEWVMTALRKGWTPELIEGRLKVEWPSDPHMRISYECLYQWIYAKPRRALDLRQYLPRGKRHRTRARGRRSKGSRIPMRVPI
ncbi:transposase, partial [Bifidobacterium longum]